MLELQARSFGDYGVKTRKIDPCHSEYAYDWLRMTLELYHYPDAHYLRGVVIMDYVCGFKLFSIQIKEEL